MAKIYNSTMEFLRTRSNLEPIMSLMGLKKMRIAINKPSED